LRSSSASFCGCLCCDGCEGGGAAPSCWRHPPAGVFSLSRLQLVFYHIKLTVQECALIINRGEKRGARKREHSGGGALQSARRAALISGGRHDGGILVEFAARADAAAAEAARLCRRVVRLRHAVLIFAHGVDAVDPALVPEEDEGEGAGRRYRIKSGACDRLANGGAASELARVPTNKKIKKITSSRNTAMRCSVGILMTKAKRSSMKVVSDL